jgi:cell division protein FtsI (penicillin-binding protein 3)
VLNVPDKLPIYNHVYRDHEGHPPQNWTLTDILTQSSNVGTIKIAQKLGPPKMREYLTKFGLGQHTGLPFPNETRGITKDGHWDATDIGSIPIGSGLGVSALQMLQVFNTLANGGEWIQPHLVKEVVGPQGRGTKPAEPERRQVVSKLTAKQMTAMMTNVVSRGTGKNAAIPGYTVAGKTGTAQKPNENNVRGYETGAYYSTFAGFVPAEAPRLSAIVVFDEPRPTYYAGQIAAPVFARIQKYALRQFKIPAPQRGLGVSVPAAEPTAINRQD